MDTQVPTRDWEDRQADEKTARKRKSSNSLLMSQRKYPWRGVLATNNGSTILWPRCRERRYLSMERQTNDLSRGLLTVRPSERRVKGDAA